MALLWQFSVRLTDLCLHHPLFHNKHTSKIQSSTIHHLLLHQLLYNLHYKFWPYYVFNVTIRDYSKEIKIIVRCIYISSKHPLNFAHHCLLFAALKMLLYIHYINLYLPWKMCTILGEIRYSGGQYVLDGYDVQCQLEMGKNYSKFESRPPTPGCTCLCSK